MGKARVVQDGGGGVGKARAGQGGGGGVGKARVGQGGGGGVGKARAGQGGGGGVGKARVGQGGGGGVGKARVGQGGGGGCPLSHSAMGSDPPTLVDRTTDTTENITFQQTRNVGSKKQRQHSYLYEDTYRILASSVLSLDRKQLMKSSNS